MNATQHNSSTQQITEAMTRLMNLDRTEALIFTLLTTFLCLIGIPANFINCLVFWRQGLKDRMNLCLFCLALVDWLNLVCELLVFSIGPLIPYYDRNAGELFWKNTQYLLGILYGSKLTSHCITMLIAIDRCLCVVMPLQLSSFLKTRTVGILIAICFTLFQMFYGMTPAIFENDVIVTGKSVMWLVKPSAFYNENKIFVFLFYFVFLGTVLPCISLLIVSVTTVITIVKLRAAMMWRRTTSAGEDNSRQVALTVMLVVVSCVYIGTMVPFMARQILFTVSVEGRSFVTLTMVVNVLVVINSSIHFFIYCRCSSRFQVELRALVICRCWRRLYRRDMKSAVSSVGPCNNGCNGDSSTIPSSSRASYTSVTP